MLVLIFSAVPIRVIWGWFLPGSSAGRSRQGCLLSPTALPWSFLQIGYWTLWGWLHIGLGASRDELNDNWDIYSVPLAWINPAFLIRSDKWLSDVSGTIMGNSIFEALVFFGLYTAVRARLDRNRAIRLKISDADSEDEQ